MAAKIEMCRKEKSTKIVTKNMKNRNSTLKTAVACAAIGWMCWGAENVCQAQYPPNAAGLSPDLQEVVKLSQARMPDDVIKNYINSSGKAYYLSANDIIYLNSQGVSSGVIAALQSTAQANPVPTAPPPPAPAYNQPPPPDASTTCNPPHRRPRRSISNIFTISFRPSAPGSISEA